MSARRLLVLCSLALAALPSSAAAVVEGAPGRIAFTSDRDGNSEIYTAWPDGSEPARLTDDPAADRSPAFSPDASRIAFTTFRDGAEAIYVMNADGSGQTRVSPDLVGTARDSLPAWSPDGTKLAFASTRPFGDGSAIWVMDANGENLRRVTTDFGSHPSWSPDGQQIAYVGRGEAIHVVNADAWDPHRITFGTLPEGDPAWSPSGGQLAIARYPEDWPASNARDLFIVDSRGSWEVQLTSGGSFDANPSWAPDGSRIVLQRHQGAGRLLQGRRRRPGAVLARRRSGLERPDGLGARLARSVLHRRVRGPLGHGDERFGRGGSKLPPLRPSPLDDRPCGRPRAPAARQRPRKVARLGVRSQKAGRPCRD